MWKFKLHFPFGGYEGIVLLFVFIAGIAAFLLSGLTGYPPLMIAIPAAAMLLTAVSVYLIQNFNPKELKKIRSAKEPEWRVLTATEYDDLLSQKVKKSHAFKHLRNVQAPVMIIAILAKAPLLFIILEIIACTVVFTHSIIIWLISAKWENVDGTARIAEIPLDHRILLGKDLVCYVYYTPKGRFVVSHDDLATDRTVKIVKWSGSCLYLE